jgi:predicted nucleic acid-binding protein
VKLLVPEAGSDDAIALWLGAERIVSSLLLYPEARSALGRAVRTRRLDSEKLDGARSLAERLWRDIDRIVPTDGLVRHAGGLAEEHALRAYDAVHLASLLSMTSDELVLVAGDGDLLVAAAACEITTARVP